MSSSKNEDKYILTEHNGYNYDGCNMEVDRSHKSDPLTQSEFELDVSSTTESSALLDAEVQITSDRKPPTGARLLVELFAKTEERRWSVALSSLVVSILALLVGLSIAFPSNAVLDLKGDATELPQDFLFSTLMLSIFAVRLITSFAKCPISFIKYSRTRVKTYIIFIISIYCIYPLFMVPYAVLLTSYRELKV